MFCFSFKDKFFYNLALNKHCIYYEYTLIFVRKETLPKVKILAAENFKLLANNKLAYLIHAFSSIQINSF
jgi:hypothetical protein